MEESNCEQHSPAIPFPPFSVVVKLIVDCLPGIDAAGFHFVVSTTSGLSLAEDRKAIKSHVTKAQKRRRKPAELYSWINPERRLTPANGGPSQRLASAVSAQCLRLVGGDFSGLQLPLGVEPDMIQDLMRLLNLNRQGLYPYEACLHVHPVERGWFPYLLNDLCCLHSMMFSIRAFMDVPSQGGQISPRAAVHYAETLRLLQARLNGCGDGERGVVLGNSTLMVITLLAEAAQMSGDFAAAENHLDGLLRIVQMRGGLQSMNVEDNMHVKVCRADLEISLRTGSRPRLFRENMSWDCFLSGRGLIRCGHKSQESIVNSISETMGQQLRNIWKDLHVFSCMSNLAYQTTGKLSPDTYNETMISILYRLTHLSFENYTLQEAIRRALLAYTSTLFMIRPFMQKPYEHLFTLLTSSLLEIYHSASIEKLPPSFSMWIIMVFHMISKGSQHTGEWSHTWLQNAILATRLSTWPEIRHILKSVMWVDFVHDEIGQEVFKTAMSTRKTAHAISMTPGTT